MALEGSCAPADAASCSPDKERAATTHTPAIARHSSRHRARTLTHPFGVTLIRLEERLLRRPLRFLAYAQTALESIFNFFPLGAARVRHVAHSRGTFPASPSARAVRTCRLVLYRDVTVT